MYRIIASLATAHLWLSVASLVLASEPVVVLNASGRPEGVHNLNIGGKEYNVDFVWGSFSDVFGDSNDASTTPTFWREPDKAMTAVHLYGQSLDRWSGDGWPTYVFDGSMKSVKTFSPVEIAADGGVRGVAHFWGGQWYGSLETCEGLPDQFFSCPPSEWPDFMYATYALAVPEPSGLLFAIAGLSFALPVLRRERASSRGDDVQSRPRRN